jgi:hypothetical protein
MRIISYAVVFRNSYLLILSCYTAYSSYRSIDLSTDLGLMSHLIAFPCSDRPLGSIETIILMNCNHIYFIQGLIISRSLSADPSLMSHLFTCMYIPNERLHLVEPLLNHSTVSMLYTKDLRQIPYISYINT